MSLPIVECIPNFSEARRPDVIDSIRQAITSVPDVSVLDQHSDLDHNRTVITFAGAPQGVEEAAFRWQSRCICMRKLPPNLNVRIWKHTAAASMKA